MRRNLKRIIKLFFQIAIILLVLCMGANIIARGLHMIYGKPFYILAKETADDVVGQIGITLMRKTGVVFSYLYREDEPVSLISKILEKTYMVDEYMKPEIEYPKEDNICKDLISDYFAKKKYEESNYLENTIPVISVIPDYSDNQGTGDTGDVGQVGEVLSPFVRPLPPEVIGEKYSLSQLMDFDVLLRNFYVAEINTKVDETILDVSDMISADMTLKEEDSKYPQILIFHTHSQETYADSRPGIVEDTVVGMGEYLAEILERDYGYHVLHITTPFDYINDNLDRSKAYEYAQEALEEILETYPTIEVILDIHRDGVNDDVHLVTEYNGKNAAKIMFVNGISRINDRKIEYLNNPNINDNLAFSFQLQLKGEAYFPGLMRRIIIKAYRYNLHFKPKSALIELGAQTNTVEEARNAVELLAIMLGEVLQ